MGIGNSVILYQLFSDIYAFQNDISVNKFVFVQVFEERNSPAKWVEKIAHHVGILAKRGMDWPERADRNALVGGGDSATYIKAKNDALVWLRQQNNIPQKLSYPETFNGATGPGSSRANWIIEHWVGWDEKREDPPSIGDMKTFFAWFQENVHYSSEWSDGDKWEDVYPWLEQYEQWRVDQRRPWPFGRGSRSNDLNSGN